MFRYGLTIFLSAFLLFQVQPIIARFILPWFGGTAAVWTTCLMFFQTVLLFGYLYAHCLRKLPLKLALAIHWVMLLIGVVGAGIVPDERWQPQGGENLTVSIVQLLAMTVGIPYFVLATTGPLIQSWQGSSHPGQSPYRLYALSNLGSMLGLLTYPFLVERFVPHLQQATIWSVGFWVFAGLCVVASWQAYRLNSWAKAGAIPDAEKVESHNKNVGFMAPVAWVIYAMAASIVLLATTNLMCQEVASVPFLWILPLSLYLLSFIICFDRPGLYRRRVFIPFLVVGAAASVLIIHLNVYAGLTLQVGCLSATCFAASMVCHGELERLKPDSSRLTLFYLGVSVGGALGGVFVCVVAPRIFTAFCEFHVGILISLFVAGLATYQHWQKHSAYGRVLVVPLGMGVFLAAGMTLTSLAFFLEPSWQKQVVFRGRNEYGLAAVEDIESRQYRRFVNGQIEHGGQSLEPDRMLDHISYYVPGSGVSVAFDAIRESTDRELNVGVIGLGAGAMKTWLRPGDEIVFYEINPMVKLIAEQYFTYLSNGPGFSKVVLGDGRIELQNRLESGQPKFDLLFMDAFASDSIPVHLLTEECLDVYFSNLKPDGILIAHITNRFIDLRPVMLAHAQRYDVQPILIEYSSKEANVYTRWVLLTHNKSVQQSVAVQSHLQEWPTDVEPISWTDDYASVAALLDWSAGVDWERIQQSVSRESKGANDLPEPHATSEPAGDEFDSQ